MDGSEVVSADVIGAGVGCTDVGGTDVFDSGVGGTGVGCADMEGASVVDASVSATGVGVTMLSGVGECSMFIRVAIVGRVELGEVRCVWGAGASVGVRTMAAQTKMV